MIWWGTAGLLIGFVVVTQLILLRIRWNQMLEEIDGILGLPPMVFHLPPTEQPWQSKTPPKNNSHLLISARGMSKRRSTTTFTELRSVLKPIESRNRQKNCKS